jgi:hypothetical protein
LDTYAPSKFSSLSFSADPVGAGENQTVSFSFNMDRIPEDGVVKVALGNLMPASDETQLEYIGNEGTKAIFEFRPSRNSGTFKLLTADFWEDLSVELSAYKFTPASESAGRSLFNFSGKFSKDYLSGTAEAVSYTFFVPQYYEDMVIEVELRGLQFNQNNLPADWSDWRDLGNGVYAVQYKPSGFLNAVTMNLVTAITTASETCTVSLQAKGYNNHTSTIEVLRNITIPNGKLIMNLPNNTTTFRNSNSNAQDRRIYIYKADDNTLLGNYSYQCSNNSRTATNNMAITLNNVTSGTSIYVTYTRGGVTYKSPNFTIGDAIDNNGVTQTLTRQ